jgi:hypothetical protein
VVFKDFPMGVAEDAAAVGDHNLFNTRWNAVAVAIQRVGATDAIRSHVGALTRMQMSLYSFQWLWLSAVSFHRWEASRSWCCSW